MSFFSHESRLTSPSMAVFRKSCGILLLGLAVSSFRTFFSLVPALCVLSGLFLYVTVFGTLRSLVGVLWVVRLFSF